jgi:quinol-cytochrome oxidoreductase complex cytochrome b subunit
VRRDGGIAVPPVTERSSKQRITRFELLRREVLMMLAAGAVLLLVSALIPAPLAPPISAAGGLSGESRAPWFFLWVQWLLKLGDPFVWGVLAPVLVVLALALLPYLLPAPKSEQVGRWFSRGNRAAQALALVILSAILILTILGALAR